MKTKGQHKLAMGTNVWLQHVKSRLVDGKIRLHALLSPWQPDSAETIIKNPYLSTQVAYPL